jgi:multidrug efflux system membrane fusion protein
MNLNNRLSRWYSLFYIAAVLPVILITGCKKQAPFARPAPLVNVTEAFARDVPLYLDEIGTCTAREVVSIRPQVSGKIIEIHFADGADLKKGDPLFTIDPRPFQAVLDQAKASLAQSEASLTLAQADFERAKQLLPAKAISQEDYDTRKNAVQVGQAQVKASNAAIETAQVNLDYCYINSPIDGRASLRQVDVGNVVTANTGSGSSTSNTSNVLLVIQRLDPIYADFTITERELSTVRQHMAESILKTQVRLPDEPEDAGREGDLTFLDNAVQNATGTVRLRATLLNSDHHFWPGQFVNVRLVLSTIKDAVLIPASATQISQKGPYVYVIGPDLTAELRPIKLGQRQGAFVVVPEGLKAGEKIVTAGQIMVMPGGKVQIQQPLAQEQAPDANDQDQKTGDKQ